VPSTWILNAPTDIPQFWERYAALGARRTFKKGATVYAVGELPDQFYYLQSGRVQLHCDRSDGRQRILAILEPGATFGESSCFGNIPRYVSATTLEDSETLAFTPEAAFDAMAGDQEMIRHVLHSMARKQRSLGLQAEASALMRTDARVALLLSHLGAAYGLRKPGDGPGHLRIHVPTEQLAGMLGMSRITLSRSLSELIDAGAIVRDKRDLVLVDRAVLMRFAGVQV
jgi:CRP-like cAMP-binding protein